MIEFRTLGAIDLRAAEGLQLHSLLAQPKRIALLAYLSVAKPHGFHRRDTLLSLFWPESDVAHARTSLRNALHILRHALGEIAVLTRGDEEVGLDRTLLWCDAVSFEEKAAAQRFEDALALYRGDFLAGFYLDDTPDFDRWVEGERSKMRAAAATAARFGAEKLARNDRFTDAIGFAKLSLELAATDERSLRVLVNILSQAGDRAAALDAYEKFADHLARQFKAQPSPATRALVEGIRSDRQATTGGATDRVSSAAQSSSGAMSRAVDESLPFESIADTRQKRSWKTVIRGTSIALTATAVAAVTFALVNARKEAVGANTTVHQVTYSGRATRPALSPDGQYLAYVVADGDSQQVVVQDLAAEGPPNRIARITEPTTMEWSPTGTQLLFGSFDLDQSRGLVFTLPRSGGDPHPLDLASHIGANVWAHWIPESARASSHVSIHSDIDRRVLAVDLQTEDTIPIPVSGNYDAIFGGAWSPTGTLFAATIKSPKPVEWQIAVTGRDGRTQVVVHDSLGLGWPHWSASGDAIYYARGTTSVWRVPVSPSTGSLRGAPQIVRGDLEILARRFLDVSDISLSSNAQRLAYASGRRYSNIWLVRPDSASPKPLTTGTALRWSPVVSPDGLWIAFVQQTADDAEIFRMPVDGGPASQLTFGARVASHGSIAWSPDGKQIAFGSVRNGHSRVWITSVDNAHRRPLTDTELSPYQGHIAWAPASRIAYLNPLQDRVAFVDAASGKVTMLVPPHPTTVMHSPEYSPDGTKLAAAWGRGAGNLGVWVFDLTGSSPPKKIADRWLFPSGWSSDGRYVYASIYNAPTLYRLNTGGGEKSEPIIDPSKTWRGLERNGRLPEMVCSPAGVRKPGAFLCTVFDYVSDITIIDNFDPARN